MSLLKILMKKMKMNDNVEKMNYNEFMQLIREWGDTKTTYAIAFNDKTYNLKLERKMKSTAMKLFNQICDAASRRFPGGIKYIEVSKSKAS